MTEAIVVHVDDRPTRRLARVRGSLDVFSSALLAGRTLAGIPDTARALVLDLDEVVFVDSAGISALVRLRREAGARAIEVSARLGRARSRLNGTIVELVQRVLPCEED
jgi:anti-anti-sigma regulatory factor